jgi:hypothetical protein
MNNIMQLAQVLRTQQNPQQYLLSMANQDPVIARAMEMTKGKTNDEVMELVNNLANSQGVDINQLRAQLGG